MEQAFYRQLHDIKPYRANEMMRDHTSFRVGGPADAFVEPDNVDQLAAILRLASRWNVPHLVVGAGSNLLVADDGFRGVVVRLGDAFGAVARDGDVITAGAGVSLAKLASFAQRHGLTGLEFAAGIPGALGGGVFMNAGAYGGEMADVVVETTSLSPDGETVVISGAEHAFRYRGSVFCDRELTVTAVKLRLQPGDPDAIRAKMRELGRRRREKQPLEYPSAGSAFKRPDGYFAGKLIEDAGLKGRTVGGAAVSAKHSGFIVNQNNATARDIYDLICLVRRTVYSAFHVLLEPEVRLVGDFPPLEP